MKKGRFIGAAASCAIAALPLVCSSARAQTAPDATVAGADVDVRSGELTSHDIVVTGGRLRREAVQDTPIAVSVADAKSIEALHATDMRALQALAPNLRIAQIQSNQGTPLVFLRGFGSYGADISSEPGVAIYVDGVYRATVSNALSDLFDVERVEVLRGPQSSLWGKNASAGAILVSRSRPDPSAFEGRVTGEYGSFNLWQLQGLVNVPVVEDKLAVKFYAMHRERDGHQKNLYLGVRTGGENISTIRGGLMFTPTPDINVYASVDFIRTHNQQLASRYAPIATATPCVQFNVCPSNTDLDYNENILGSVRKPLSKDYNAVLNADWTIGGAKLVSITGYHRQKIVNFNDIDVTPATILEAYDQTFNIKEFSQEFRIQSTEGGGLDLDGRFSWLIGGYYNRSNGFMAQPLIAFVPSAVPGVGILVYTNQSQRVLRRTLAAFANASFEITDKLGVSGGLRHSEDRVRHDFSLRAVGADPNNLPFVTPFVPLPYSQARKDTNLSFEGGAHYKFSRSKMVYLRYAEGYRGGGFIGFPATLAQAEVPPAPGTFGGFGPETSRSYEAGLKTEWFGGKFLFNATVFNTTYNDLQRSQSIANPVDPTLFVLVTRNIAKARMRGFEIEANWRPIPQFNVRSAIGYVKPKYLEYTVAGVDRRSDKFPLYNRWTVNVNPSYRFDLGSGIFGFDTLEISGSVDYRSKCYCSSTANPFFVQPGFALLNAEATLQSGDNYDISVYATNLTDKGYITLGTIVGGAPTTAFYADGMPRQIGVKLSARF